MNRRPTNTIAVAAGTLAALFGAAMPAHAQFTPGNDVFTSDPTGSDLASVSIRSERTAIVPGETSWIAVHFAIEPGWHLYWENPGDSGQPPFMEWTLPAGVTLGDPLWPVPHRHVSPGDILDYTYEDTLTILYPLTLDKGTDAESVTLKVAADYLICKELCLFGDGSASATLTVANESADSSDAPIFERTRLGLPREPARASESGLNVTWSDDTLRITAPGATRLELFPHRGSDLAKPAELVTKGSTQGDTLVIPTPRTDDRQTVAGVVSIHTNGKTIHQEFRISAGE